MAPAYEATEGHDSRTPLAVGRRLRHRVPMRGTGLVVGALLVVATACGDARSSSPADVSPTYDGPVERPTAVPGAEGRVVTSTPVIVTDDDADQSWFDLAAPVVDKYKVLATSFMRSTNIVYASCLYSTSGSFCPHER